MGLSLPVQQGHSESLLSNASNHTSYSAARGTLFWCTRAAASFGCSECLSISFLQSLCLFSIGQGSPFRYSRAAAPFGRNLSPPSELRCVLWGGVRALTPIAAESQAPFGRCESPSSEASNRTPYSAARGTLLSGEADPQLPSD